MFRRGALVVGALFVLTNLAGSAHAVHLFPLFPGDPSGDCGANLKIAPKRMSPAKVMVNGFMFSDSSAMSSTTTVKPGQSVTWEWGLGHCHSVTSKIVPKGAKKFTTKGGVGSEKELVKPDGMKNSYTVKFTKPGTYEYVCVHHEMVGMTGKVIVKK